MELGRKEGKGKYNVELELGMIYCTSSKGPLEENGWKKPGCGEEVREGWGPKLGNEDILQTHITGS